MRYFSAAIFVFFVSMAVSAYAIEISPAKPLVLKQQLLGDQPINTEDETGYWWYPKTDLGVSLDQATSGLQRYFLTVSRLVLPGGGPGFDGESVDGRLTLHVAGPEQAIKRISINKIPFCIDPVRFAQGSWSDAEPAVEILSALIGGVIPGSRGRDAHEIAVGVVRDIFSKPLRNLMTKELLSLDGCLNLGCQYGNHVERTLDQVAVLIVRCSLRSINVEITPPRSK